VNISNSKDGIIEAYQERVKVLTARAKRLQERVGVLTKDRDKWVSEAELHSGDAARLETEVKLLSGQLRKERQHPEFHNLNKLADP
jgi:hypothetical protein